jgi:hypothetical protein
LGNFCNFQNNAQIKQLPNGRKISQSGHPGRGLSFKNEVKPSKLFLIASAFFLIAKYF